MQWGGEGRQWRLEFLSNSSNYSDRDESTPRLSLQAWAYRGRLNKWPLAKSRASHRYWNISHAPAFADTIEARRK